MKTVGIIAEYNPFHNGHLYQMQEARKRSGADYVIVAMSPDFVQRGEPALLDKWVRARMALSAGADLVLELPVRAASGSAEYFAQGGVSLLSCLGVVDALSFGYEGAPIPAGIPNVSGIQTDLGHLMDAAAFFSQKESDSYKNELKGLLNSGMTYAQARCDAYLKAAGSAIPEELLKSPNNILAIEYLKAINQIQSSMSVIPIPRKGAGYHDTALPLQSAGKEAVNAAARDIGSAVLSSGGQDIGRTILNAAAQGLSKGVVSAAGDLGKEIVTAAAQDIGNAVLGSGSDEDSPASASGIRAAISKQEPVAEYMPKDAHSLMMDELMAQRSLVLSDLDLLLHDALLRNKDHLAEYQDVGTDLANRINSLLGEYTGFESFAMQVKTRQLTLTRVKRALLHILLDIRGGSRPVSYARVLGFRKTAQPLLHQISQNASVPLITKLPEQAPEELQEDLYAAQLWEMLVCHKTGKPVRSEYQRQLVII